jgi:hypothetical protein
MIKRRVALSALLAGALLLAAVPALANGTVHDVWPAAETNWDVAMGDTVVIHLGWYAATKGQVRVYLNHTTQSLTLSLPDDPPVWEMSPADVRALWSPLEPFPEEWVGLDCPMPTLWVTWWSFTLPDDVLAAPGTYEIVYRGSFDKPVNDGLHACVVLEGPFVPTPSLYRGTFAHVSTITVVGP